MSIIKRKAGSEDIVKSILEFDEVPTEGSPNLVESGAVAQSIGNLGKPLQWKGPATVAQLNAGITGIQSGWTYTLTDAGTLTDGSIAVEAGDEVAWTEDDEWFKVGGEGSKIAVFECRDNGNDQNFFTGPTYAELEAARTAGKTIVLLVHYGFDTVVDRYFMMTNYSYGRAAFTYKFTEANEGRVLKFGGIDSDIEHHTWSRSTLTGSVVIFTGTYNPVASPSDYSGMPNTPDIEAALNAGNDVVLMLNNPVDSNVYAYRLVCNEQYTKRFMAFYNDSSVGGWQYMPAVVMTYAGPGNPWGWASTRYLSQELRQGTITESDIYGGHCGVNNLNALTKMTLTSVNSVTMHTNDYNAVNNFCVEIDNTGNSNDVTIGVQHGTDSLKYSVNGGNVVGAGKYMQLTCVGSCWTLAEFTAPTP